MSVIVTDMDMPNSCSACDFSDIYKTVEGEDKFVCERTWSSTLEYDEYKNKRLQNCPLRNESSSLELHIELSKEQLQACVEQAVEKMRKELGMKGERDDL